MCWLKRLMLFSLAAGVASSLAGCGSHAMQSAGASDSPTARETDQSVATTETSSDDPASPDQEIFVSTDNLPIMPEIFVPDEWLRPIDDEESFFSPPPTKVSVQERAEPKTRHENVRLLGFAVSLENPDVRKAILKIGRAMYFLAPGDSEAGVKVLGMSRYTVHLERDGERWSLALHDQPIVNAPVIPDVKPHSLSSPGTGTGRFTASTHPGSEPGIPGMPELPEVPPMPKLPGIEDGKDGLAELPGLDGDLELPGLGDGDSGLPQLPGLGEGESGLPQLPGIDGGSAGLPDAGGAPPGMSGSGGGLPDGTGPGSFPGGLDGGLPDGAPSP